MAPRVRESVQRSETRRYRTQVQWRTEENGGSVVYDDEPGVDPLRRFKVEALSLLPIEDQL
jgi:hypothetical protein